MNPLVEHSVPGLHAALAEVIRDLPFINSESKILDLGAGSGAFLARLNELGYSHLAGVDLNPINLSHLNIANYQMDLNHPNEDGIRGEFDLITSIEVIEHLENIGSFLDFVAAKLSRTGYFLISTPNIYSLTCRTRFLLRGTLKNFDEKGDQTHLFPVCIHTFNRCLRKRRLSVLSSWTYPKHGKSLVATVKLNFLNSILSIFLHNSLPGDSLCLMIGRDDA